MRFSYTACAVISSLMHTITIFQEISILVFVCVIIGLLDTVYNHSTDVFSLHRLCICQSTWYSLQSSKECVFLISFIQLSVYWIQLITIQKMMRLSSTAFAVVSLSNTAYNHSRDTIFWHCLCNYQSIQYDYNHPRDDFLRFRLCSYRPTEYSHLHRLCSHRFIDYNYNHLRDVFLRLRLCNYWPIGYGLQSSKGCVYSTLFMLSSTFWVWLKSSNRCLLEVLLGLQLSKR